MTKSMYDLLQIRSTEKRSGFWDTLQLLKPWVNNFGDLFFKWKVSVKNRTLVSGHRFDICRWRTKNVFRKLGFNIGEPKRMISFDFHCLSSWRMESFGVSEIITHESGLLLLFLTGHILVCHLYNNGAKFCVVCIFPLQSILGSVICPSGNMYTQCDKGPRMEPWGAPWVQRRGGISDCYPEKVCWINTSCFSLDQCPCCQLTFQGDPIE